MKQRKISIDVVRVGNDVPIFAKEMCTPQDIISALSLFGDDGVRFHIAVDDVELNVSQEQN